MAKKCKYFADNGKPSQLFDRLYSYYAGKGMDAKAAELSAITSWLATKTDNFKDFAGDLVEENTNPKTVAVDENGEPEMLYFGESDFYADMPVTDYRTMFNSPVLFTFTPGMPKDTNFRYPFFLSIKNPKIVNVEEGFTKDDLSKATVGIDKSGYDGVVFIRTKDNGEQEKQYGVLSTESLQQVYSDYDKKVNTTFTEGPDKVRLETFQENSLMAEPVINFTSGISTTAAFLDTVLKGDNDSLAKMSRSVLLNTRESIPIKEGGGKMIAYDQGGHAIQIDPSLHLSRTVYNNIVFSETVRGHSLLASNANEMQGLDNIVQTAKARLPESEYKKYFESTNDFINGMFDNRDFIEYLKANRFPGDNKTIHELALKQIGDHFKFRESYLPLLQDAIERSLYNKELSSVKLYDEDLVEEVPVEEPKTNKKPKGFNEKAPYARYVTGDKLLDKHIKNLFEKIQALKKQVNKRGKEIENRRIRADIRRYQKDLDRLVETKALETLIDVGFVEIAKFQDALKGPVGYKEAWDNLALLKGWSTLYNDIRENVNDPKILEAVEKISFKASTMHVDYSKLAWKGTVDFVTAEGISQDYIAEFTPDQTIQDISQAEANFTGLSFGEHGLEIATQHIISSRAFNINQESIVFERKRDELIKKLGSKDLSFMFKKDDTGRIRPITSYKTELYEKMEELRKAAIETVVDLKPMEKQKLDLKEEYKKAKKDGDKMLMAIINGKIRKIDMLIEDEKKKRTTWDTRAEYMRQNFDYVLSEKGIEEFNAYAEILKESFWHMGVDGTKEFNQNAYDQAVKEHDPRLLMEWVADNKKPYPKSAASYVAITPKAQWKNNEYDGLTPVQKEFYDFFVGEFLKANSNVPMDYSFTDYNSDQLLREFAYMEKTTADQFGKIRKEVTNFIKDIASVEYQEHDVSYDVTAPVSERTVKKVKLKHISSFTRGTDGYWKETEKDKLPTSLKDGLAEGRYKFKDGYLVFAVEGPKFETMVKKYIAIEDDPLTIFNNFVMFGLNYKYKSEVEDVLNSIIEITHSIPKQASNKKGIVNPMGLLFGTTGDSNMTDRMEYTVDAFLHEILKEPSAQTGGVPGERAFSFRQLVENINNFTRARQLGYNPISGITNLSMGTINNFIYAGRDEFFNEGDLRTAYLYLKDSIVSFYTAGKGKVGDAQKIMLLMQNFNMLGGMKERLMLDKEWVNKLFEHLFIFQKGGEYLNQGAVVLAMMLREKIDVNGEKVSMWDAFEVVDGQLHFKYDDVEKYPGLRYQSQKDLFVFSQAAKKVIKEIHSDYDPDNPIRAKSQLRGRVGMLFRTWLPQSIKQRLGRRYKDAELSTWKGEEVWREGRWNTFGRVMNVFTNTAKDKETGTTRGDKWKNFATFLGAIAANTISARAGRKIMNSLNLNATDKANMNANVKEAWWLLTVFTSTMLMLKLKIKDDDDDDDKDYITQSALRFIYNQASRVENELYFFYSPWSFSTIFRDAIPLWSTLQQGWKTVDAAGPFIFGSEEDTYKRGFRKGDSKFATQLELFFPVSKQLQSTWSMWSQVYSDKFR